MREALMSVGMYLLELSIVCSQRKRDVKRLHTVGKTVEADESRLVLRRRLDAQIVIRHS